MKRFHSDAPATATTEERERPFIMFSLEEFALIPARQAAWYFFLIGMGAGLLGLALALGWYVLFVPAAALFFSGLGATWLLFRRLDEYDYAIDYTRTERRHIAEEEPDTAHLVHFDLGNGLGGVNIWEPRQGAFRAWLRAVLADDDKRVHFSRNQAIDRGWTEERYQHLVVQLREVGLLDKSETSNGRPVCTSTGKTFAKLW